MRLLGDQGERDRSTSTSGGEHLPPDGVRTLRFEVVVRPGTFAGVSRGLHKRNAIAVVERWLVRWKERGRRSATTQPPVETPVTI